MWTQLVGFFRGLGGLPQNPAAMREALRTALGQELFDQAQEGLIDQLINYLNERLKPLLDQFGQCMTSLDNLNNQRTILEDEIRAANLAEGELENALAAEELGLLQAEAGLEAFNTHYPCP